MTQATVESPPTLQEWQVLFQAANVFYQLAPWDWMWDSETFGVQDPETGEIGYGCIMGRLGEHFALAVYEGSEGLAGLSQMREGGPEGDPIDILMLQKCLMASFEDRSLLQKRDLDQIKALGLKFRGRNAWPQFRSYLPGYEPWYLTGAQARFLTVALQQACDVALRFRDDPRMLSKAMRRGEYLVRRQQPDGSWEDTFARPAPVPVSSVKAAPLDDLTTARAKRLQRLPQTHGTLELDFSYMPGGVKDEGGGRPYFPYIVLAVDPASEMVLHFDLVKPGELAPALPKALLDVVEKVGMLPDRVLVRQEQALSLLQPLARLLGVRVSRVRRLTALDAALESMTAFMGGAPLPF
jgi:hypothetical protein